MQMLDGIQALEIYSDEICYIFRYSLASSDLGYNTTKSSLHTVTHTYR